MCQARNRLRSGRAYRYGLADDAHAAILAKLEAPLNPETQLAQVLDWEDEPRLRRAIEEMCEIDDVNYWAIRTQTLFLKRNDLGYRFLILFVVVSLMAAWLTQDIKWLLGTPSTDWRRYVQVPNSSLLYFFSTR